MRRLLILSTILLLVTSSLLAAPPRQLGAALDKIIAKFQSKPQCHKAKVGIVIQSLDDQSIWYTRKQDTPFIPASTAKVVIAAMALRYLPSDFAFATRLYTFSDLSAVKDGVLPGNLILQGRGDPLLTAEDLEQLATQLATGDAAHGIPPITQITGRLLLDGSYFPRQGPLLGFAWEASDLPWYYAAPASALSCNRNAILLTVTGSIDGLPPTVTLSPETDLFTIENQAITSTGVKSGGIDVLPNKYQVRIKGRIAPDAQWTEKISVAQPERLLAEQCEQALLRHGIIIQGAYVKEPDAQQKYLLAEHRSAPLRDVVTTMMKESDNHTAEQLRWTLLAESHCDVDLTKRFQALLNDFAGEIHLNVHSMSLCDSCGLSRANTITPAGMSALLASQVSSPTFSDFYASLPIAGIDGTMKKRLLGTAAANNLRAKTGTMRGVSTLAGYMSTATGERLSLVIFVNGYNSGATEVRNMQDQIAVLLASGQ